MQRTSHSSARGGRFIAPSLLVGTTIAHLLDCTWFWQCPLAPNRGLSVSVAVRDSDATAMRTRQQRYDTMKDRDRVMRALLAWDRTAAISVVLAVFAWLFDAALETYVSHIVGSTWSRRYV